MKPTLLFATLSMVFAVPQAFAVTELETLRARCTEQERHIRELEDQVQKLKSVTSGQSASAAKATTATSSNIHTVRPGESLEGIARRAGCSSVKLAKANGLKPSAIIHPGQKLKLPGAAVVQSPSSTKPAPATRAAMASNTVPEGKTHKIQAGETFASISRKNHVSIDSLVAANPGVKPTALRPGQVIRLSPAAPVSAPTIKQTSHIASTQPVPRTPAVSMHETISTPVVATKRAEAPTQQVAKTPPTSTPAKAETTVETLASVPAQEKTPTPANPEKKIRSVTIEGEMTYGDFAATHGTDTSRLNDLNGLDLTNATVLAKGSELYVPAQP